MINQASTSSFRFNDTEPDNGCAFISTVAGIASIGDPLRTVVV